MKNVFKRNRMENFVMLIHEEQRVMNICFHKKNSVNSRSLINAPTPPHHVGGPFTNDYDVSYFITIYFINENLFGLPSPKRVNFSFTTNCDLE